MHESHMFIIEIGGINNYWQQELVGEIQKEDIIFWLEEPLSE